MAYTLSQSGSGIAIVITWELITLGKQQVFVKAKGYVYVFEQLIWLWLDLLPVEQLLDILLG